MLGLDKTKVKLNCPNHPFISNCLAFWSSKVAHILAIRCSPTRLQAEKNLSQESICGYIMATSERAISHRTSHYLSLCLFLAWIALGNNRNNYPIQDIIVMPNGKWMALGPGRNFCLTWKIRWLNPGPEVTSSECLPLSYGPRSTLLRVYLTNMLPTV